MGDVADMMLDGTLCEGCGVFLNEDAPGFPCYCAACKRERKKDFPDQPEPAAKTGGLKKLPRVKCAQCGRWISPRGMQKHIHDKHTEHVK